MSFYPSAIALYVRLTAPSAQGWQMALLPGWLVWWADRWGSVATNFSWHTVSPWSFWLLLPNTSTPIGRIGGWSRPWSLRRHCRTLHDHWLHDAYCERLPQNPGWQRSPRSGSVGIPLALGTHCVGWPPRGVGAVDGRCSLPRPLRLHPIPVRRPLREGYAAGE